MLLPGAVPAGLCMYQMLGTAVALVGAAGMTNTLEHVLGSCSITGMT